MASSFETPLGVYQTASSGLRGIKANQNIILDLNPSNYDAFLEPLIECLQNSLLFIALSKTENVPLSLLSEAYSSA